MRKIIVNKPLKGIINAPASKSQAHRLLICAALSQNDCHIGLRGLSADIKATVNCLKALGAEIEIRDEEIFVKQNILYNYKELDCGESGSTLRFLLPVMGALGISGEFLMRERLPERPLAPLDRELCAHCMTLEKCGDKLHFNGKLKPGHYTLPGSVSSQYISGLLFALPLLSGDSELEVTGNIESLPYIEMTEAALNKAGIRISRENSVYSIPGAQRYSLPEYTEVEGDWSNAAFWLCAGAMQTEGLSVKGLDMASMQGDRKILDILHDFGAEVSVCENTVTVRGGELHGLLIDAAQIPDLIPALSVTATEAEGVTRIINAGRLRIKESDRLHAIYELINSLGGDVREDKDELLIRCGKALNGGSVSSQNDHRIAMAAAISVLNCKNSLAINGAEAVNKSYPDFFEVFEEAQR